MNQRRTLLALKEVYFAAIISAAPCTKEMMAGNVRYVGRFKRDRFDGPGSMIWPNGNRISGEWKNSQLFGIGTYTPSDGESFKVKMTEKGIDRVQ